MLRSVRELRGYSVPATNGEIGKVDEFYFDDKEWTIRYLVVDIVNGLAGRRVLISPIALGEPDSAGQMFPVILTREEVENSPDIDTDKPVSPDKRRSNYKVTKLGPCTGGVVWAPLSAREPPAFIQECQAR